MARADGEKLRAEVSSLWPDEAAKEAEGRDEQEYSERYGYPTTYRLPRELAETIREIADQEHVGISELVQWILARFVRRYEAGEIELPKTEKEVKYTLDDTV